MLTRFHVIAEGVETEEQPAALRAISGATAADSELHRLQGFLFSRPVGADSIRELFRRIQDGDAAVPPVRTASGSR